MLDLEDILAQMEACNGGDLLHPEDECDDVIGEVKSIAEGLEFL